LTETVVENTQKHTPNDLGIELFPYSSYKYVYHKGANYV